MFTAIIGAFIVILSGVVLMGMCACVETYANNKDACGEELITVFNS